MKNNPLFWPLLALAVVATAGIAAIAPSFAFHVRSAYSGQEFWLTFAHEPTEEELLDAVIDKEPLFKDAGNPKQQWRAAQGAGGHFDIRIDGNHSLRVMPYRPGESPDVFLPSGYRVKGRWLTEPETRIELAPFVTKTLLPILVFALGVATAFLAVRFVQYLLHNCLYAIIALGLLFAVFAPVSASEAEQAHSVIPYVYFEILRCFVFGAASYGAFRLRDRQAWLWTMVTVAVVFNPVVPARFSKEAWEILDVAAGGFFIAAISRFRRGPVDAR